MALLRFDSISAILRRVPRKKNMEKMLLYIRKFGYNKLFFLPLVAPLTVFYCTRYFTQFPCFFAVSYLPFVSPARLYH